MPYGWMHSKGGNVASETQRSELRLDTGTDDTSLIDDEIDAIYVTAENLYSDATAADAYARVVVFRRLLAQAAARTTYKQNQSSENLSDLFDHYKAMLAVWESTLSSASGLAIGAVLLGRTKRVPSRWKEHPNS
jgi:hypothetical protein